MSILHRHKCRFPEICLLLEFQLVLDIPFVQHWDPLFSTGGVACETNSMHIQQEPIHIALGANRMCLADHIFSHDHPLTMILVGALAVL